MPLIMAINPPKKKSRKAKKRKAKRTMKIKTLLPHTIKKRRTAKKGAKKMPFKKSKKPASTPTIVIHKTAPRSRIVHANPATRRAARKVAGYARRTLGGINIGGAAKSALPMLVGALITKFAAKKWGGEPSATEGENWTWKQYLVGIIGGFAGAFATSAVFKGRRDVAQKVFEGSMLLTLYKILINEVAAKNESLTTWFGADDDDASLPQLPAAYQGDGYVPGQIYPADEATYVKGADGYWKPVNDAPRANNVAGYLGDVVRPVDPAFGDVVRPVDPAFGQSDDFKQWSELYPG